MYTCEVIHKFIYKKNILLEYSNLEVEEIEIKNSDSLKKSPEFLFYILKGFKNLFMET